MSQEPINIAGVCAFPNPNGVRDMRFVDCNYNTLFRLPNHSSIIMTKPDGTQMKQQCSYIDDYHIYIGQCGFHIMEFAEMAWRNGYTYLPEHPREQDCCDTYALYQIKDVIKTDYFCCTYERANGRIRPADSLSVTATFCWSIKAESRLPTMWRPKNSRSCPTALRRSFPSRIRWKGPSVNTSLSDEEAMMELNLKPMSKLEQQYSYSHDEAVDAATRCLGHLRGDMGSTGKAFYFTWFDHCGELKTPAFKSEFDDVINALRFDEAYHGILSSRSAMSSYCYKHPECSYGSGVREHGVRIDTEDYSYLLRLNPNPGEYNFYCYCYEKEALDRHLAQQKEPTKPQKKHEMER